MEQFGRLFIIVGVIFIVVGIILTYSGALSFLKLGRLPGDIAIKRENFRFYFPITTSILLSAVLTLILYLLRK
jgi:hypothetical protein